jgi:NitT/TauT family transport system substrate-binding protein
MNKTAIWIVGAVIILVGGMWYFGSAQNTSKQPETTKIKIGYAPLVHGLPFFYALDKGYFKDAGLDVEAVRFEAQNQAVDAVMTGQLDFLSTSGAHAITAVAATKNPGKIEIFAVSGGDETVKHDSVLIKNDSPIKSIADLKGKKMGILAGLQSRAIAQAILAQSNLVADKDVTLVELAPGLQPAALASGQIDALYGVEPIPTIVKVKQIGKDLVPTPTLTVVANPFWAGAASVNTEFARKNPKATAVVLDVFNRAIKEIASNPDAARPHLKGYTALDDSLLAQGPVMRFKMHDQLTVKDKDAIQKFYDFLTEYKMIDTKMDFQKMVYAK